MILQKIDFSESECEQLIFRGGSVFEDCLSISSGDTATLDTYFGCFSYPVFLKYTRVEKIDFSADIQGECLVSLVCYDGERRTVLASLSAKNEQVKLTVDITGLPPLGILYPEFHAISDAMIRDVAYRADVSPNDSIKCAVAICTYKREAYVIRNINVLSSANISGIEKVFVIDNGKSIDASQFDTDFAKVLPNENYGGSAGFTRGIIEAYKAGFTHVILMDDDVHIYPSSLCRMVAFASVLREEYKNINISAAMLRASEPYIQHELGARWHKSHIESQKCDVDIRRADVLVDNLDNEHVAYGAWWCLFMPLSNVERFGLPLPFFIKFDDVEYGIRCSASEDIVTMNGIAVMHEDFERKYSMHLEYYNIRNQLITLASHKKMNAFGAILRLFKTSARHLLLYRYDNMPLVLAAFSDFLRGPDFLIETDAEELNKQIMNMAPKTSKLTDIPRWDARMKEQCSRGKFNAAKALAMLLTLGGHLIPAFMIRGRISSFPLPDARLWESFASEMSIQYQLGSDYGFRFSRSVKKFFKYSAKTLGMAFKLLFGYRKAACAFREKYSTLTSIDFWNSYLKLDK